MVFFLFFFFTGGVDVCASLKKKVFILLVMSVCVRQFVVVFTDFLIFLIFYWS